MFNSNYGFEVQGYEGRVVNEREIRAGGGILFLLGILTLFNAVALDHFILAQIFLSFFVVDMILRLSLIHFSPSLLLGKFIVRNQKPEYVGAAQKRFTWIIALLMALPIFYSTVIIDFVYTPFIVWVCILCLILIFLETAFGICYGCIVYSAFMKEKAKHCPGGSCEITFKEPSQKFSPLQKGILFIFSGVLLVGLYFYTTEINNKTYFGEHMQELLMSSDTLKQKEDAVYQKEVDDFFEDEDW